MSKLNILLYGDSYNEKFGIGLSYTSLLSEYGAVTLINPWNVRQYMIDNADILVLPGGADIDPERYGERPDWYTQRANLQYEWMDRHVLPQWIKTGKPIIGICRGMQDLNVVMGGTLFQHIWGHIGNNDRREKAHHEIYTDIETEDEDFRVYNTNSFHHQCVKRLADGFEILGWSAAIRNCPSISRKNRKNRLTMKMKWEVGKNGLVTHGDGKMYYAIPEIIRHETLPYIGFQYHPEDMNCTLFHHLVTEMLAKHGYSLED